MPSDWKPDVCSKLFNELLKYGFCDKSFQKDEPLTSWTLFSTYLSSKLDFPLIKTLERIRFSSNLNTGEGESNLDDKYSISSYSFLPWIVSAHLCTVTFGFPNPKKISFRGNYMRKYGILKKVFNWSEVHLSETTCYKIHTLVANLEKSIR